MREKARIYSAGPWIGEKEIEYVNDAVRTGWYDRCNDYVERLEKEMCTYLGVKYALATTNGTAALHLAACALRLSAGDEVILPDISWAASAHAIAYTGATPVFVDVEESNWCLDPVKVEEAITEKTRAVMPVQLYGMVADMDRLMRLAREHNLAVIEDAAPALGSAYKGRKAGTFGRIGCFSFQGAKMLVTGEGGMFVTDDEQCYARARLLAEHGRDDRQKVFWCGELGFQYTMANPLAALGLAQLERIDEIMAGKRQIFSWYDEEFKGMQGMRLVRENKDLISNYAYPSLLLDAGLAVSRDELRKKLQEQNIDSRPAFPRMSSFPHLRARQATPVARKIEECGLNLPCALNLTRKDVTRIAGLVKKILRS